MKLIFQLFFILFVSVPAYTQEITDTIALRQSLDKATAAIRKAFEDGDAVEQGAREWFQNSKVEFVENTVENTEFVGNIAIQTVIFSFKTTPKNGGKSTIGGRGRSMVIYIQDKTSPTGWLTLREIAQEGPPK